MDGGIKMNCHENKENVVQSRHKGKKHSSMKHMLMMAMCCGLPIILLLILPFLGIFGTGFKASLASRIPFVCPVMMIFMIPMMLRPSKNGKSCCSENNEKKTLLDKNE
jgi:hypothetical protein